MRATEIVRGLAEKVEAFRGSAEFKTYLDFVSSFHKYSYYNQLLIYYSKKNPTRVAGIKKWNELDRRVKRGERGIAILAPMFYKQKIESEGQTQELEKIYFRIVYVFDIAQTEGAPVPELKWKSDQVDDFGLLDKLESYCRKLNISIKYEEIKSGAQGYSSGGSVTIQNKIPLGAKAHVLLHEISHEIIHQKDKELKKTREMREVEAEGTAYVVAKHFGIEADDNSVPYLSLWSEKDKIIDAIKTISNTAKQIINNIEIEGGDKHDRI